MSNLTKVWIRECELEEAKIFLEFAEKERWDYTMYDYLAYMRLDPNFLLVAIDPKGVPVGFGGINKNASETMYLSSFIVREDLRKQGIGRKIWKALIERAGDKNVALDGAPEMQDWYGKQGFVHKSFGVLFYTVTKSNLEITGKKPSIKIVPLSEDLWTTVMLYDRLVYPDTDREHILRAWFTGTDVRAVVALKGEKIVGYGSIHKKHENEYGLRNILADNESVFESILHELFSDISDCSTVHFLLIDNKVLPKCLRLSVYENENTQRMYSKFPITINTEKIWLATAHFL